MWDRYFLLVRAGTETAADESRVADCASNQCAGARSRGRRRAEAAGSRARKDRRGPACSSRRNFGFFHHGSDDPPKRYRVLVEDLRSGMEFAFLCERNRHPEQCAAFSRPLSSILKREVVWYVYVARRKRKEDAQGSGAGRKPGARQGTVRSRAFSGGDHAGFRRTAHRQGARPGVLPGV